MLEFYGFAILALIGATVSDDWTFKCHRKVYLELPCKNAKLFKTVMTLHVRKVGLVLCAPS